MGRPNPRTIAKSEIGKPPGQRPRAGRRRVGFQKPAGTMRHRIRLPPAPQRKRTTVFAVFGRPRRRHTPPLLRTQSPPTTKRHRHRLTPAAPEPHCRGNRNGPARNAANMPDGIRAGTPIQTPTPPQRHTPGSSPGAARHKPNTGQRHNQTKEQTQWKKSFSIAALQPGRHP